MYGTTINMFDGATYEERLDRSRLKGQLRRVAEAMMDGTWRTLAEIQQLTDDPQASISARLRDLRKDRFGGHTVRRRRRGDPSDGLFEYKVVWNR